MMKTLILYLGVMIVCPICWAQIQFQDISSSAGIAYPGNKNHGLLFADYDNDGDEDIYVLSRLNENALFENQGDGSFKNVAPEVGLNLIGSARAGVWGDINNDGWIDLYVGVNKRLDILFLNQGPDEFGQISFLNISLSAGIDNFSEPRSAHMVDLDRDGYLDIYVANYHDENRIFHNQGKLQFIDKMPEWQIDGNDFSMGCVFFDYDRDGDEDVYLTHDFLQANVLYRNNGKGYFEDVSSAAGVDFVGHGMGVDVADINHDGWLDIYLTDFHENLLFQNQGDGTFTNIAEAYGAGDPGMGWSCMFVDADNDSWVDIYVVNETSFNPQPNVLLRNIKGQRFEHIDSEDVSASNGDGVGGAFADINQDGFPDIAIANTFAARGNQLFKNVAGSHHWIGFKLEGTQSNRSAIGARIEIVHAGGETQTDQVIAGSGFASQHTLTCYFGLGTTETVDEIRVFWPGGLTETYTDFSADQVYHLKEHTPLGFRSVHIFPPTPNPFVDHVSFRVELKKTALLSVFATDIQGRRIHSFFENPHEKGMLFFHWETEALPPGMYFLEAYVSGELAVKHKIFKQTD